MSFSLVYVILGTCTIFGVLLTITSRKIKNITNEIWSNQYEKFHPRDLTVSIDSCQWENPYLNTFECKIHIFYKLTCIGPIFEYMYTLWRHIWKLSSDTSSLKRHLTDTCTLFLKVKRKYEIQRPTMNRSNTLKL